MPSPPPTAAPPRIQIAQTDRVSILPLRTELLSVDGRRISSLSGDKSPEARHWVARFDGVDVGCVSVMAFRGFVLRGMAVRPDHQNRGIGSALLKTVCTDVDGPMWCNAVVDAVRFYAERGWVAVGPRFDMGAVGLTQRMTWTPMEAPEGSARPSRG